MSTRFAGNDLKAGPEVYVPFAQSPVPFPFGRGHRPWPAQREPRPLTVCAVFLCVRLW
jgi:hypothetical protein